MASKLLLINSFKWLNILNVNQRSIENRTKVENLEIEFLCALLYWKFQCDAIENETRQVFLIFH